MPTTRAASFMPTVPVLSRNSKDKPMHDDFAFEPIRGLPGHLPEGEEILWQGNPHWWTLAKEALSLYWIAAYFGVLVIWRVGVSSTTHSMADALGHGIPFVILGLAACALLCLIAYVQARATVYTLTNRRVMMRIGAALQMTLNLPYTWINNANLAENNNGTGTIALDLKGETKISYLMSWPHVRPWRMAKTEPALRCIPDVAEVASIFAKAAETRVSDSSTVRVSAPDALPAE